ncbi:zinc ribbon domain-containing protein [Caballeronia sp. PC1]|nr:zinc ribbon domain-containing protein [Caballeronia sp. PC1]MCE4546350.1 transposase [Caballeronia sp. PC1]
MNRGKHARVSALLHAWRRVAVLHGREQWRRFYQHGVFDARLKTRTGQDQIGAAFVQMIRHQVVGALESYMSNRQNDFSEMVNRSSLDERTRHQLHFINRWRAWQTLSVPLVMRDGSTIPEAVRRLARNLFRAVMKRHRLPALHRVNMVIDQRAVSITPSRNASHFRLWARLSTLDKGKRVDLPLQTYSHFTTRAGNRALTVQVNQRQDGSFGVGILTDVTDAFAASRAAYRPRCEALALDLGLNTLLATDQGDLVGRQWRSKLDYHDRRITELAAYLQKRGLKPNHSSRYRARVSALRGWLKSEVNRCLNRLVAVRAPAEVIVERLDFQAPGLSRRLNRLISNMGRGFIEAKLKDLEERFGIRCTKVIAAYSSQTDSACGYVDKNNRTAQARFKCRWCGHRQHADVNAARNLVRRRSPGLTDTGRASRDALLSALVRQHVERFTRPRGRPADPRLSNPYFSAWAASVR